MPQRYPTQRAHFLLIPLAALLAVFPMLLRGPSCGHDFDFHLLSWLETATQFAHFGFPHWAFTPAWNAGEPRFIFYPPLSWTLGGALGIVLPWTLVPAAYTWICLTLSGFTAFHLTRQYAEPASATFAATLYLANPYMLFTAYERSAYGELLAAAFLPLLFQAALADEVRVLPVAGAVALLWLTNAPAAVMGCYALAFLTLVRLIAARHKAHLALTTTAGTLLGLALAAFYILPAAYERRFVEIEMAVATGMRPSDHFLFHRMLPLTPDNDFHNAVVRTASIVALLLLAAIAAVFTATRGSHGSQHSQSSQHSRDPRLPLALLALLIAFLLTPASLFLWKVLPQLHFLQFPWRLCALLAVILCLFFATAVRIRLTPAFTALAAFTLAAALITPAWLLFRQPCDADDAVPARVALFHSTRGTEPTDEYTPADADPEALHPEDPPYWLIPANASIDTPAPAEALPGPTPDQLLLRIMVPEVLILNRRAYPGWRVEVNDSPVTPRIRTDGLMAIQLPAGRDTISLTFLETPDREAGLALSSLTAFAILFVTYRHRQRSADPRS